MSPDNSSTEFSSALVAMSGGIDSTVAAMLAIEEGIECAGAIMKLYPGASHGASDIESDGEPDARTAAEQLGIQLHIFDFSEFFEKQVIERFIEAYREGRTPNPCIDCNRNLKFGRLLEKAHEMGKDGIITGHYAQIERAANGRYLLKKGTDPAKDQSYVLYSLKQEQLSCIRFPLGGLTKSEVREIAHSAGLKNAKKKESQDICFVPDGDYAGFIEKHTEEHPREGRFIDAGGNDLGKSKSIIHYTIGQRRGLGLAMPYPPYVLDIRPETDTIVIGRNEQLYSKSLVMRDINIIPAERLDAPVRAHVKIRYNHAGQPATVRQIGDDALQVEFDEPQRAITKGQAAVIYDDETVIGGGTIG